MKKIVTIIAIALVCVLGLAGCGTASKVDKVDFKTQNFNYSISGNGGSVVQYGNYLYFINGTRGYEDTDATNNVAGKVIKGALYRAELTGEMTDIKGSVIIDGDKLVNGDYKTGNTAKFRIERDAKSGIRLVSEKGTSYDNKEINVVNVELISSKTVGTSGYAKGGLYAYNGYIYFVSPCNQKNKSGKVMTDYNEFYRVCLATGETQKLLTSETANASKPYGVYCYDNKIYLNYVETGDSDRIMSVLIDEKTGDVIEKKIIADKVTDVLMPVKSEYYYNIPTDTVYDFIYYGTKGSDIDNYRTDTVMSFVRPDGSENTIFNYGGDAALLDVQGGMLLYKMTVGGIMQIRATDMYNYFVDGSQSFKKIHGEEKYEGAFESDGTVLSSSAIKSATAINCFVPGIGVNTNAVYTVLTSANATTSSNNDLTLYAPDGSAKVIASGSGAKVVNHTTDKLFYVMTEDSVLKLHSVDLTGANDTVVYSDVTEATFMTDIQADYLVFFGKADGEYSGYTFFYDLNGLEGDNDPFFVGKKLESETKSNVGEIKLNTENAKLAYRKGDGVDVSGLTLTAYTHADKDGEKTVIEENVAVTSDMISGFDTSAVADAVTVTVTYKGATATYEISVADSTEKAGCGAAVGWTIGIIALVAVAAIAIILFTKKKEA